MKCDRLEPLKGITTVEEPKRAAGRGLDSKSQGNARLYLDGPASTVNGLNCHPVSAAVMLSLCSADARMT